MLFLSILHNRLKLLSFFTMTSMINISKLVDYLLLNAYSVNSSGLYNGKAGISLCLFEMSRFLQDEYIEEQAFELLKEFLLTKNEDIGFENGLSGVGYVLLYLIQKDFVGGTFYFDHNGNYLGKIGSSNDIKIGTSVSDSNAISFSTVDRETMGKVLTTMGQSIGIYGDVAIGRGDDRYWGGQENGQIYVNYYASFIGENNYYDFLMVLHHEHYHQMMWQYGYNFSDAQEEYQALIYEMNHAGYQNTSEYYRSKTTEIYDKYHSGNYGSYGY